VRDIIRQSDATRLHVMRQIYQQRYGLEAQHAEQFAYLEYAAFSGNILLDPEIPMTQQQELAQLYDRTIARTLTVYSRNLTSKKLRSGACGHSNAERPE